MSRVSPHHEFYRTLCYQIPENYIPADILEAINSSNIMPVFYSDGSCAGQEVHNTRYAAYALVLDIAEDDDQRYQQVNRFLATGFKPDTFLCVASSRLKGRQGIHRAELTAITILAEQLQSFHVHTDSTVAITAFQLAGKASSPLAFQGHPDFDLVYRLWKVRTVDQHIFKVQAHQTDFTGKPLPEIYHALGNDAADEAAVAANRDQLPEVLTELQQHQQEVHQQRQSLLLVYRYLIDLQMARAQAEHPNDEHVSEQPLHHELLAMLREWTPSNPWVFPQVQLRDNLQHCAWGQQCAHAVVEFCQQCVWPAEEEPVGGQHLGISWTELALGLVLFLGTWLPIKRKDRHGDAYLIWIADHQQALAQHVTMAEQSDAAAKLFRHVQMLLGSNIYPPSKFGRVRSLYVMGESYIGKGFSIRPRIPRQTEMLSLLSESIANGRSLPEIPGHVERWRCDHDRSQTPFPELLKKATAAGKTAKQFVAKQSALANSQ
eukprot:Skav208940  [mRNA]  locus=scaffold1880:16603:18072:+ [translate_table: standard]